MPSNLYVLIIHLLIKRSFIFAATPPTLAKLLLLIPLSLHWSFHRVFCPNLIGLETPHLAENSYSLANSESSVQELLSSRIHRPDYQPEDFIDFTLTIEIPDVSDQATAAFFCTYPILLDLVRSTCFDRAPVYPSSHSEFTAYHDGNLVSQTYTMKKSFNWQSAGKTAQSYLRTFDPAPHASRLKDLAIY